MSREYDNTNRGVLFKNQDKQEGSNGPDYSGNINVGGQEYFLDAWIKTGKESGKKFMSLSVKPKRPRSAAPAKSSDGNGPPF